MTYTFAEFRSFIRESQASMTAQEALRGTHIVIFGGSSGIGLATAAVATASGASVTLVGRTLAKLEAAARELGEARIAVADIADDAMSRPCSTA